MWTFLTLVVGLLVIAGLRYAGHSSVIDRGDAPGSPRRPLWNKHSRYHALGAALVAIPSGYTAGWLAGLLVGFGLGIAVELAQKFPHDKKDGYIEWSDLLWDVAGALAGAVLGALARGMFT